MKQLAKRFWLTMVVLSGLVTLTLFQNCSQTKFGSTSNSGPASSQENGTNGGFDGKLTYIHYIHRGSSCTRSPDDVDTRIRLNLEHMVAELTRENCQDILPVRSISFADMLIVTSGPTAVVYLPTLMILDREDILTTTPNTELRVTLLHCLAPTSSGIAGVDVYYNVSDPTHSLGELSGLTGTVSQVLNVAGAWPLANLVSAASADTTQSFTLYWTPSSTYGGGSYTVGNVTKPLSPLTCYHK